MSFLSAFGSDVKKVFAWIGTPAAQTVIGTGEAVVESLVPAATGIITLANTWMQEIIKTEAIAAAAGQQNGSGVQKSAAVINALTPEVLAFASANKLPVPDSATIQKASDALVLFLNAFPSATPPAQSAT
jgi:hypothetical protein